MGGWLELGQRRLGQASWVHLGRPAGTGTRPRLPQGSAKPQLPSVPRIRRTPKLTFYRVRGAPDGPGWAWALPTLYPQPVLPPGGRNGQRWRPQGQPTLGARGSAWAGVREGGAQGTCGPQGTRATASPPLHSLTTVCPSS